MKLDSIELYNKFQENGVYFLYHANSLTTSLGFICNGGLFSRGAMENRYIPQTEQSSDLLDKQFNVWNDIFLDTIDLHGYRYSSGYKRHNEYGPVLFIFNLELLLDSAFNNIWITTNNPTNWNRNDNVQGRYFRTVDDYIQNMNNNRQQKMITIRDMNIPVSFNTYLNCIILDNPRRLFNNSQIDIYQYAYDKLHNAVNGVGLNVDIIEHECNDCFCFRNYELMDEMNINKFFLDFTN